MNTESKRFRPWLMLILRSLLFAAVQGLFALGFVLAGRASPWEASANWWPIVVVIANLVTLTLLIRFFKIEGGNFWSVFKIQRSTLGKDILVMLGLFLLTAPISFLPNIGLAKALFGDENATLELFIRPLPMWAIYFSLVAFSVTQGMIELPNYVLYALPGLEKNGMPRWSATLVTSLFLSLQHIAVPLLFNGRFLAWRALMFLPFALFVSVCLRWRPRLMPYFAIGHALMDAMTITMFLPFGY
jgi:hypothetical protein